MKISISFFSQTVDWKTQDQKNAKDFEYIEPTQKIIGNRKQRQSDLLDPIVVAGKIYEVGNDDFDQPRYLVGDDAESYFAKRKEIGQKNIWK